jgi:hypothetical protein
MVIIAMIALLALVSIISIVVSAEDPDRRIDPARNPLMWTMLSRR